MSGLQAIKLLVVRRVNKILIRLIKIDNKCGEMRQLRFAEIGFIVNKKVFQLAFTSQNEMSGTVLNRWIFNGRLWTVHRFSISDLVITLSPNEGMI
jgi:hypothetical protein